MKTTMLAAAFAMLPPILGGVRILDTAGNRNFASVQPAINAAAAGEILLVGQDYYSNERLHVSGKAVSIFGAGLGAVLPDEYGSTITHVDEGSVVIVNLKISGSDGLAIYGNKGHVRLQDCGIGNTNGYTEGLFCSDNSDVLMTRCKVSGAYGRYTGEDGGDGLVVSSTRMALYECVISGGDGSDDEFYGGDGGTGVRGASFWMFSSLTTFRGGKGGHGTDPYGFGFGGDGGDGFVLGPGQLVAHQTSSTAGPAGSGTYQNGQPGTAWSFQGGTLTTLTGSTPRFQVPTSGSDVRPLFVTANGPVGATAYLVVATTPGFRFLPVFLGVWTSVVAPITAFEIKHLGKIGSSGKLVGQVALQHLPSDVAARVYFVQGLVVDDQGHRILGSPLHHLSLNEDSPPDCNGNGVQDYYEVLTGLVPDANHNLIPDGCPGG